MGERKEKSFSCAMVAHLEDNPLFLLRKFESCLVISIWAFVLSYIDHILLKLCMEKKKRIKTIVKRRFDYHQLKLCNLTHGSFKLDCVSA